MLFHMVKHTLSQAQVADQLKRSAKTESHWASPKKQIFKSSANAN